ncbi:hypothetical protein H2200_005163 [Cladophialophora chaetospira]|uniref:G domain-containing protein n=1 Tax=Cladophialophora chaetospira TaxID=386627 RepID=A0AA38XBN2_9EURO|nr:hypothetical protein H2200_005163 [Cladophialophora chaetospira]
MASSRENVHLEMQGHCPPASDEMEDITAIAVMGVTGSGKSNFIRCATNSDRIKVGHNMQSCTEAVEQYEMLLDGRQVLLFDTPGFDDTYRLDAEILAELAETFSAMYKNRLQLAGIIYVHRITDNRMTNTLLRNLSIIRNICGDEPLKNVTIMTTFWDKEDAKVAAKREREMLEKADWWGYMMEKGARSRRFFNKEESAHAILQEFMDRNRITLQIQTEMVEQGLEIKDTQAGSSLNVEITQLAKQHKEELRALEAKMDDAERRNDVKLQEMLVTERREKEKELTRMQLEQMAMERDRSEDMRRMEQTFQDQLLRLVEERKDRESQIAELERQLTQERAESTKRFESAMQNSEMNLLKISERFEHTRIEDRERFQQQMADYKKDRDEALRQYKDDLQRTNAEIVRMFEEKQGASEDEKERLENEIAELKKRKKRNMAFLFAKIGGVALCSALAPFTGGLSTLAMPIFSAFGGSGGSGGYDAN